MERPSLERIGDGHTLEFQTRAKITSHYARGKAGRPLGIECRVDRPGDHDELYTRWDRGAVRKLVDRPQLALWHAERDRPIVCVLAGRGRAKPGKVLGSGGHARPLLSRDEAGPEARDCPRIAAERAPILIDEVSRR